MFLYRSLLAGAVLAVAAVCCAAGPVSIGNILPTAEGTTMTLAGTAAGWKDSWKPTAPNTFYLTDATGSIRVCIWPDDLTEVPPTAADALKKKGTPIRLTGEVAIFRERVELHVKDGGSVSVITAGAPTAAPAAHAPHAVPAAPGQVPVAPGQVPTAPAASSPATLSVPAGYTAPASSAAR